MSLLSRRTTPSSRAPTNGYSLLDSQLTVSGNIRTVGSLRIDGHLEGCILDADTVVIGVGASVVGDVQARELVVGGELTGNVLASERVELQATAIVNGDIATQVVLVQEGGVINGRVRMPSSHAGSRNAPHAEEALAQASPQGEG